jgi:hypothetical protein
MPEAKFFTDSATEVGLNPNKVQALMDRAEHERGHSSRLSGGNRP